MTIQANFPAIKPALLLDFQNTKQLDSRITYTRASTATFYNGVTTAMAEQNLVLQSQTFDNASWVKSATTVTANTTVAPDGTTTAETLAEDTATSAHFTYQTGLGVVGSKTYSFSVYGKNISGQYLNLSVFNVNNTTSYGAAIFDLSTGAVSSSGASGTGYSVVSTNVTSVGSGWYRCELVMTTGTSADVMWATIAMANSTTLGSYGITSYTGTSRSIAIWGAQLENRSAISAYTATTTQAITNYIPVLQTAASGVARFDNNPTTGESLGLLIEESRTNLATYSSDLSNAAWSKVQTTVTSDTVVAPDGTLIGDKLVESTSTSTHYLISASSVSVTSGTAYTISLYAKASGRNFVVIEMNSAALGAYAWFDLANGVVGTTGGSPSSTSITSVGNGWYRLTISKTATSSTTSLITIYTASVDNATSYTGNGFSGVFLWGIQYEAGAFATSYIPTVASQVTRAADAASMTGTNFSTWFNQGQGSFIINAARAAVQDSTGSGGYGRILGNDANNNSFLEYEPVTNVLSVSGVGAYRFTVPSLSTAASVFNNMAVAYDSSGISVTANNAAVQVNSSARMRTSDRLNIFGTGSGAYSSSGWVKKIAYYPIKVTSTNMQALTS